MRSKAMRRYWIVVTAIVVVTLLRIATTHLTFAQTLDEPVHIGAGHEWLTHGTYGLDFEHPPLPRALFALPFLKSRGTHWTNSGDYGNDLLEQDHRYIHNIAAARRGNLVFVAIALFALAACTRRLFGDVAAIIALLLFANLPPVLAHGGLATTDMAGVAAFALALYALLTSSNPIFIGATIAFGIACKYSFPIFFAPTFFIAPRIRKSVAQWGGGALAAASVALLLTWGLFHFSIGTLDTALPMVRAAHLNEHWAHINLPAPSLLLGYVALRVHNQAGHTAFLLGHVSHDGWWYYFLVALALKTPIPFLLLALAGIRRRTAFLALIAASILALAMTSRINIGVRHILPIYIPLSMLAAFAVVELWRTRARAGVVIAIGWLVISSVRAHPDYIPWMNALAGREPQRALLDSNFDWGQDIWRLAQICHKRGINWLGYAVVTSVNPASIDIAGGAPLSEDTPTHGWVVISEQSLILARVANPRAYAWLDQQPHFERVGKTLRLYHVP